VFSQDENPEFRNFGRLRLKNHEKDGALVASRQGARGGEGVESEKHWLEETPAHRCSEDWGAPPASRNPPTRKTPATNNKEECRRELPCLIG